MALLRSRSQETSYRESADAETVSPVLHALLDGMQEERRYTILDLGPACGANVAFFSRFSCRLHIADVMEAVAALDAGLEEEDLERRIADLLPQQETCFDLILCWDVLNYLPRPALKLFAGRLARFAGRDTRVHAYVSSLRELPAQPPRYTLLEDGRVRYTVSPGEARNCPRYSQPELLRLMPTLRVERGVLLRNGMQEYLFRR